MSPHGNQASLARRKPWAMLLIVTFAVMSVTACGKKGPLYLPSESTTPFAFTVLAVCSALVPAGKN